jgi:hypothetical protein
MNRDEIMERLTDADPLDESVVEAWKQSGRPEAVLAGVLASPRTPTRTRAKTTAGRRLTWAGVATVLVVAAGLGLTTWLGGHSGGAAVGDNLIDRGRALTTLIALAGTQESRGVLAPYDGNDQDGGFRAVVGLEMLRSTGAATSVSVNAASWLEAVTWLWVVYSGDEAPMASGIPLAGSWRGTEAGMIAALMRAGIVPADAARLHAPEKPLSVPDWELLLRRLEMVGTRAQP